MHTRHAITIALTCALLSSGCAKLIIKSGPMYAPSTDLGGEPGHIPVRIAVPVTRVVSIYEEGTETCVLNNGEPTSVGLVWRQTQYTSRPSDRVYYVRQEPGLGASRLSVAVDENGQLEAIGAESDASAPLAAATGLAGALGAAALGAAEMSGEPRFLQCVHEKTIDESTCDPTCAAPAFGMVAMSRVTTVPDGSTATPPPPPEPTPVEGAEDAAEGDEDAGAKARDKKTPRKKAR